MKNFPKHIQRALLAVMAVLAIAACSEAKKAATEIKQSFKYPDLMNTFESDCKEPPVIKAASAKRYYKFSGSDYTEVLDVFSGDNCAKPAYRVTYSGTFTVKGDVEHITNGRRLTIHETKATLEARSADGQKLLEAVPKGACGIAKWPPSTETQTNVRDVSAQANDATCLNHAIPADFDVIIRVDDGKTAYFGEKWLQGADRDTPSRDLELNKNREYRVVEKGIPK